MSEVERIAAGLSKAQRAYLTVKAERHRPTAHSPCCWMTFPPTNTHMKLRMLGLADQAGRISRRGLQVRAHLLTKDQPQ